MEFLSWLANAAATPLLKRWVLIGFSLVLIGFFSL
jgi:hypothetical protein